MQYDILTEQARGILEAEPWYASAMSNLSALLMTLQVLPVARILKPASWNLRAISGA